MKRIILLIILINTQFLSGQTVVLDTNGVTIKWTGTSVPNPYFVQANPRGTGMEWFAIVNNSTKSNVSNYARNLQSGRNYFTPTGHSTPIPFNNIVTTLVTQIDRMFQNANMARLVHESLQLTEISYQFLVSKEPTVIGNGEGKSVKVYPLITKSAKV